MKDEEIFEFVAPYTLCDSPRIQNALDIVEYVIKNNIRVESGIVDTNLRSIQHASKTIPNISKLLTNPLQFVTK
jgi:hypothetical protein